MNSNENQCTIFLYKQYCKRCNKYDRNLFTTTCFYSQHRSQTARIAAEHKTDNSPYLRKYITDRGLMKDQINATDC